MIVEWEWQYLLSLFSDSIPVTASATHLLLHSFVLHAVAVQLEESASLIVLAEIRGHKPGRVKFSIGESRAWKE